MTMPKWVQSIARRPRLIPLGKRARMPASPDRARRLACGRGRVAPWLWSKSRWSARAQRHRNALVEYRVEQHAASLGDRPTTVSRDENAGQNYSALGGPQCDWLPSQGYLVGKKAAGDVGACSSGG